MGQHFSVPPDKTAGQRLCPASHSLKGAVRVNLDPSPAPPSGSANPGTHLRIVANDTANNPAGEDPLTEPDDEELWLEDVARQVEADARPLFAHALAYLFRMALELDEDEPPT